MEDQIFRQLLSAFFGGMLVFAAFMIGYALDNWNTKQLVSYHCPDCGWSTPLINGESILQAKMRHDQGSVHRQLTKGKV